MKKYAVMVLAVVLVGVMSAGAWARIPLTFAGEKKGYVGEKFSALVLVNPVIGVVDWNTTIDG